MMDIMNYSKESKAGKNWLIEEAAFDERFLGKCEAIFTQGNGYLGLRNSLEESYVGELRGLFVTGTFNKASEEEVTELPNFPDICNMEIELDGERFALNRGTVKSYSRTLDLHTGETIRSVRWLSPAGAEAQLDFHRFVSYNNVHVIGSYVELTAINKDMAAKVLSGINAQVTNHGAQHFVEGPKRVLEEAYLEFPVVTTQSEVGGCVHVTHGVFAGGSRVEAASRVIDARRKLHCSYAFALKQGESVRFEKLATVHSTRDLEYSGLEKEQAEKQMAEDGRKLIAAVKEQGYAALFAASCKVWAKLWEEQDICIESKDEMDQLAIRFALYHLQIMVRKQDERMGIGAKALSGEGYKGHSFWDTETFIFPYFQFAQPEVARTLLAYRYLGLYGARKKAAENGFAGAMYPWEAAWIDDGEVTPDVVGVNVHTGETLYCLTGKIELHVTCDIAYALWQYYLTTGDEEFMERYGYEIILETARFWNSRLEWVEENGRYEIRDVIGPDEYKEHVDNNAYTNYMVAYNMELAEEVIERLEEDHRDLYDKFSKLTDLDKLREELVRKMGLLYLPKPSPESGIIEQFDGYAKLRELDLTKYKQASVVGTIFHDYSIAEVGQAQAGKQADIVELLYQMDDLVDLETKRKNYLFYEARTLHDSSLSKAIHSVLACDLGMAQEAYDMFQKAAATDLGPEMRSSDMGIHSANMGGMWQAVVMGFGGLRISQGKLRIRPHLPESWQRLEYPIYWQGRHLHVRVQQGKLSIRNEGEPFAAVIGDLELSLSAGENNFTL